MSKAQTVRLPALLLALAGMGAVAWVALALAGASPVAAAPTCTISWTGTTSTDWDTTSNWTPARLPRATDVVCMAAAPTRLAVVSSSTHTVKGVVFTNPGSSLTIAGGTTTVTEAPASANASNLVRLVVQAGTWSGNLTVATLTLTSGTLAGGTVTATGSSTACSASLDAATLVNQGTLTYDTGGACYYWPLVNGARLTNAATGTFTLVGDGTWGVLDNGGGVNRFVNAGGLVVALTAATDSSPTSAPFSNTGSVTAVTGTMELSGGSAAGTPDTGSYAIGANGGVQWSGGTRTVTSIASTGTGPLTVSGGSAVFSAGSVARLALTGGSIGGTVSVGNLTTTSSGTITGPGTITTTGNSTVCGLAMNGGRLSNQGTLTYDSSNACYYWFLQDGASFTNAAGGTFAVTGDATWGLLDNGGATSRVVNAGTTTVALTGDGVVEIGVPAANTGAMTATTGRLRLTGGGVGAVPDIGSYSGTAAGSVDLAGGTRTVTTVSGPGPLTVSGGATTFSAGSIGAVDLVGGSIGGTVSIGNLTTALNGTITGPGTVTTTGTSSVCGLSIDGGTLSNQGTLTFDSSNACYYWFFSNGASFTNAAGGTFAVSGDGTWDLLDNGGTTSRIVNAGTTTVVLAADPVSITIPFANTGAMNAATGRLLLAAGGVAAVPDTGSYSGTASSSVELAGGQRSATTVSGTGPVTVSGGTTTFGGGTIGKLVLTQGTIAGTVTIGDLTANGTNGTIAGPGTVTTTGTSTICGLHLDGTTLVNQGTTTFNTNSVCYYWFFSNAARFTNAAGGTLAVTGTGDWTVLDNGGAASAIVNAGTATVTLAAAGNAITVSIPFTNTGSLTAVRGTVTLGTVTNLSAAGVLTGGTWNGPTGTITLPRTVTTNAATVSIGATGQVVAGSTSAAAFAPLATNTGSFTIARSLALTSTALTNSGTLTVAAGTLVTTSLTQSAGTTTVAAGATLNAGTAQVRINGGTLTGSGTVRGAVSGAGTVSPGTTGAGTLTVTGTVNTTAGTTLAVTEGTSAGTTVAASGAVNAGGATIAITTTGTPAIGTVRTVLSGSSRTGTVAGLTGFDVPASGGYWVVGYTPTAVTLTLTAYPTVSVTGGTVAEGNSGTSALTFTVTLSAPSPVTATVTYTTANGSAVAGSDYTATSGTLTFAPGTTSQTVPVPVLGDTLYEADETVTLNLSSPTGSTLGTGSATGTVMNDDVAPALSVADADGATSAAGGGNVVFPVTLSAPSGLPVTVQYATVNGTAVAGTDYTATSGTLTIAAGQTSGTVTVPLTTVATYAPPKTFTLTLSNPVGATIADGTATGTIVNGNPNGPTLASVVPGQGAQGVTVPVTLNGTGFTPGATVAVSGSGVTVGGVTVVDATTITATFTLATTAPTGARAVTVTASGLSDTCSGCFTVVARPVPTGTDHPNLAIGNVDVVIGVTGSQFQPGADVVLVNGARTVPAASTTTNSPTSLTAVISVPRGTVTGSWNLQVVNPDGGRSSCQGCVTVHAAPTVASVSPSSLARGTSTAVTITGSGFVAGAVVSVPGAQLSNVTVVNSTTITATVRVPAAAVAGPVLVKVINPASAGSGFGQKQGAVTFT